MKLNEVFSAPYKYEWIKSSKAGFGTNDYVASFELTSGDVVEVTFEYWSGPELYEVEFRRGKSSTDLKSTITDEGDAYRIFATVVKIMGDFAQKHSPKFLFFSSSKKEESRGKLYKRMMKKFASDHGYLDITGQRERMKHEIAPFWMKNAINMHSKADILLLARKDMVTPE